ncbi:MAG: hypothetical protein ACLR0F_22410 [Eisenbergiella sp.]
MKEDELREFIGDDGHFSTMFDFSAAVLSEGDMDGIPAGEVTLRNGAALLNRSWRDRR